MAPGRESDILEDQCPDATRMSRLGNLDDLGDAARMEEETQLLHEMLLPNVCERLAC